MKQLLTIMCSVMSTIGTAQCTWTITNYEWRDRVTFEKYIKPEQWLSKTITFRGDTISFDFSGIQDFEDAITYKDCVLYQPIDTLEVKNKDEFFFINEFDKYLDKRKQVLIIQTMPNCYKFPFDNFIVSDNIGLIELRGTLFIMRKE